MIAGIMSTFSLHIHHMDLKNQLDSFYTKDRFKFTGLLGVFMSLVTFIGNDFFLYTNFAIDFIQTKLTRLKLVHSCLER